jgi:TrmH family RNA methyltransferase
VVDLSSRAFDAVVETETPQGILLLVALPAFDREQVIKKSGLLLLVHQLQDPGNLGSILRSAEAFGVTGVLLTEGSIKPYSQKVIRASAGAIFRMPVFSKLEAQLLIRDLQQKHYQVLAADAGGTLHFQQAGYSGRTAILVGNEGQGLPSELLLMADATIQIPLAPPVESLNVAIATALILCEAARQRR